MATRAARGGSGLRKNKLIFAAIAALMVLVFVGALTLLKSVFQTETYYVLGQDVPTRTKITTDMLVPITASAGTTPPAAMSVADIQGGYVYTKFPLQKGEILTASNAGSFEDISTGVPDSWVITSFSVSADDAVQGRIRRGTYFDMMVTDAGGSYYPFVNMLALDTTVSLSGASSNAAVDTAEAKAGQTSQYTVGLPPADAGRLQQVIKKGGVKLVLSPRQNEYNPPQIADYTGTFKYEGNPVDAGKGTDYTFTNLKRDAFGRPTEQLNNCSKGNAKVDEKTCTAAQGGTATPSNSASPTTTPTK